MAYRRLLASVLIGVVGATLLAPAAGNATTKVSWSDCDDGFQCATVPAPLDYDHPRGAQIGLSLIRLPASDQAHKIGSLLVNPGGPGGSGVDLVRGSSSIFPAEIRARFDIVGFDPRGIYRSTPLLCFDSYDQALASLPAQPFPQTPAEEQKQRAADRTLTSACARHGGAILDHMSSADAARDMDLLRRDLGDRKLTYLGFSYGSLLGQNYANLFPNNFRALVIDGVVDPTTWVGSPKSDTPVGTRIGSADGAAKTLQEFFRLCDAAGPNCAFSGGAAQRFAKLAAKLRAHPATIVDPGTGETITYTYNQMISGSLGSLYSAAVWPQFADLLAYLEAQVSPAVLGQKLADLRAALGVTAADYYENDVEGSPGVACSDTDNPSSFAAWQRAADRSERTYGLFARVWNWSWSACRDWPAGAGQDRYTGPWTTRTAAPVLVVGNYFDPATHYQGAVAASRLLPNSRLLSYAGWGHAAYLVARNDCVNDTVSRYLLTGITPKAGTVCQPQGSPFDTPAATATTATREFLPSVVKQALG